MHNHKKAVLIVDDEPMTRKMLQYVLKNTYETYTCNTVAAAISLLSKKSIHFIISDLQMPDHDGRTLLQWVRQSPQHSNTPVLVLSSTQESQVRVECLKMGANDFLVKPFNPQELLAKLEVQERLQVASSTTTCQSASVQDELPERKQKSRLLRWGKRLFDIVLSGTALLVLLPVLLLVALLIKLDSRGPIVYTSKRVGEGYRIFELYKFRTMRTDADQLLKSLSAHNLYGDASVTDTPSRCAECTEGGSCGKHLLDEGGQWICEPSYLATRYQKPAFMKFQNDPRITRLGRFLRNTSLDELPQLWNIFTGDMSLVGNRPLPLYEAEKLTTDQAIGRFNAPAGLTGLWQVTKRGKGKSDMSEAERIQLDLTYAHRYSPWLDLKIILKTFRAVFQSENV